MKLRRKRIKPIGINDVTIIDDARLRKAITAASLGNAMEWFDFGVYGFVAYALGKIFFPRSVTRNPDDRGSCHLLCSLLNPSSRRTLFWYVG